MHAKTLRFWVGLVAGIGLAVAPCGARAVNVTVPSVANSLAAQSAPDTLSFAAGVIPNGLTTTTWFRYGLTTNYDSATPLTVISVPLVGPNVNLNACLSLNGSNQNALVPGFGNYAPTNEITIEYWQKVNAPLAQSTFVLSPDHGYNRINAHTPYSDGGTYWDFGDITGNGRLSYIATNILNAWDHFAMVASQTNGYMRIYRNGVLEAQKSLMGPFTRYTADLLLGGSATDGYFSGSLTEFRVWRTALSQSTIQAWMNVPLTTNHPAWTNLVAYWPINEGAGTNLLDQSGNHRNATLTNNPTWQAVLNSQTAFVTTISNPPVGVLLHCQVVVSNAAGVALGPDLTVTTSPFGRVFPQFPGTVGAAAAFGDFFNAGRFDVLLGGSPSTYYSNSVNQIWRFAGNGGFTNLNLPFPEAQYGPIALADLDNDGLLDVVVTGAAPNSQSLLSQIWHNLGNGVFTNWNVPLPGLSANMLTVADFDNDGRADILVGGVQGQLEDTNASIMAPQLWHNDGGGSFSPRSTGLPSVFFGSLVAADFDQDGLPDVLITGVTRSTYAAAISQVWRNLGNGTFAKFADLPGMVLTSAAAADFDADGLTDILMIGNDTNGNPATLLLRNLGHGAFTNVNSGLPAMAQGSMSVADLDNDGYPDLLLTGMETNIGTATLIFRNLGNGTFTNLSAALPFVGNGRTAIGDYSNSGQQAIFLTGMGQFGPISELFQYAGSRTNMGSSAPATLVSVPGPGTTVTLSWSPGSDLQTPTPGLTYNLRIGSTPGGSDILAPESDPVTGRRRLPQDGNAGQALSKTFTLPSGGTFYWSVQTVDAAYAGSAFAPEAQVSVGLPRATTLPATGANFTSASLNGTAVANAAAAAAFFQWGVGTNLSYTTGQEILPAGTNAALLTLLAAPLLPGTTYSYRLVSFNAYGTNYGATLNFTTPAETPPQLGDLANVSVRTNSTVGPILLGVSDQETPASNLLVSVGCSNPSLVPAANLILGGSGTERSLTIIATNHTGLAAIFVTVSDGLASTTKAFVLTVTTNAVTPPPPGFVSLTAQPGGRLVAQYYATAGFNYTLLSSTNLAQWSPLTTVTPVGSGLSQVVLTNLQSVPRQFFRLRYP